MSVKSLVDEFVAMTRYPINPAWVQAGYGAWQFTTVPNPPRFALDPGFPGRDTTVWYHQHVFTAATCKNAKIKAMLDNQPPFSSADLTKDRP